MRRAIVSLGGLGEENGGRKKKLYFAKETEIGAN